MACSERSRDHKSLSRRMPLSLNRLRLLAEDPARPPFCSIHHIGGLDPHYEFGPARWIESAKRPHFLFSYEDKDVQRRLHDLLSAIYDPLFLDCSHGWRPHRSRFTAREALHSISQKEVCLIRADVSRCFHSIPHRHLEDFLDLRVTDGVVRRLIRRFLSSIAIIGGERIPNKQGVLLGSVLGPILANIYLHYVLDKWFTNNFTHSTLVRYGDDFAIVSAIDCSGGRMLGLIEGRLRNNGLRLNEAKTSLIYPDAGESMSLLGFRVSKPSRHVAVIRGEQTRHETNPYRESV